MAVIIPEEKLELVARELCRIAGYNPDVALMTVSAFMAELKQHAALSQPGEVTEGIAAFDAAIAAELPCVSTVPYNSHEICKWFAGNVRERLTAALGAQTRE